VNMKDEDQNAKNAVEVAYVNTENKDHDAKNVILLNRCSNPKNGA